MPSYTCPTCKKELKSNLPQCIKMHEKSKEHQKFNGCKCDLVGGGYGTKEYKENMNLKGGGPLVNKRLIKDKKYLSVI